MLFIVTGLTGSGKTTVYDALRKMYPEIIPLKIDTTMSMSDYMYDEITYNSVTKDDFNKKLNNDEYFIYKTYSGKRKKEIEYYGFKKDSLFYTKDYIVEIQPSDVSTFTEFYKDICPIVIFNMQCTKRKAHELASANAYTSIINVIKNLQEAGFSDIIDKPLVDIDKVEYNDPFDDYLFNVKFEEERTFNDNYMLKATQSSKNSIKEFRIDIAKDFPSTLTKSTCYKCGDYTELPNLSVCDPIQYNEEKYQPFLHLYEKFDIPLFERTFKERFALALDNFDKENTIKFGPVKKTTLISESEIHSYTKARENQKIRRSGKPLPEGENESFTIGNVPVNLNDYSDASLAESDEYYAEYLLRLESEELAEEGEQQTEEEELIDFSQYLIDPPKTEETMGNSEDSIDL